LRRLQVTLHFFLGTTAIGAGAPLVYTPSGKPLGFERAWLAGSPFDDYLAPGLFMVLVLGPLNLARASALLRRRRYDTRMSTATGLLLLAWLMVQTLIIGFRHPSQIWPALFGLVTLLGLRLMWDDRRATRVHEP